MEIKEEKYEMNIGKFPVYSWLCFLFLLSIMSEFGGKEIDAQEWEDTFDTPPEPLVIN